MDDLLKIKGKNIVVMTWQMNEARKNTFCMVNVLHI